MERHVYQFPCYKNIHVVYSHWAEPRPGPKQWRTRMHSSRMCTARFGGHNSNRNRKQMGRLILRGSFHIVRHFTARQRSCVKIMFLQACVYPRGGVCLSQVPSRGGWWVCLLHPLKGTPAVLNGPGSINVKTPLEVTVNNPHPPIAP